MAPRPLSPRRGNAVASVDSRLTELPRTQSFQLPRIGQGIIVESEFTVTQAAHGFTSEACAIFWDPLLMQWSLAEPTDILANGDQILAMITSIISADKFKAAYDGELDVEGSAWAALTDNTVYYAGGVAGSLLTLSGLGAASAVAKRAMVTTRTDGRVYIHGPQHWGGHDHATCDTITQVGHGFAFDDVICRTSGSATWLAASDSGYADLRGMVVGVIDADNFIVCTSGVIYRPGGVAGTLYSLSSTPGVLTATYTGASIPVLYQVDTQRAVLMNLTNPVVGKISDPTHGNARGTDATDFQNTRTNAAHVASGDYAVIVGGYDNEVSADYGFAVGYQNLVTADAGIAMGSVCAASGIAAVAMGNTVSVSGGASAGLGQNVVVAGNHSFCMSLDLLGFTCSVAGNGSFAMGGRLSVSHDNAGVLGLGTVGLASDNGANTLTLYYTSGVFLTGSLFFNQPATGLSIKNQTNAKCGTAALTAGAVVVANTSITANSRIFVTHSSFSGTPGVLRCGITVGTSFSIVSSSATDAGNVSWFIVENP